MVKITNYLSENIIRSIEPIKLAFYSRVLESFNEQDLKEIAKNDGLRSPDDIDKLLTAQSLIWRVSQLSEPAAATLKDSLRKGYGLQTIIDQAALVLSHQIPESTKEQHLLRLKAGIQKKIENEERERLRALARPFTLFTSWQYYGRLVAMATLLAITAITFTYLKGRENAELISYAKKHLADVEHTIRYQSIENLLKEPSTFSRRFDAIPKTNPTLGIDLTALAAIDEQNILDSDNKVDRLFVIRKKKHYDQFIEENFAAPGLPKAEFLKAKVMLQHKDIFSYATPDALASMRQALEKGATIPGLFDYSHLLAYANEEFLRLKPDGDEKALAGALRSLLTIAQQHPGTPLRDTVLSMGIGIYSPKTTTLWDERAFFVPPDRFIMLKEEFQRHCPAIAFTSINPSYGIRKDLFEEAISTSNNPHLYYLAHLLPIMEKCADLRENSAVNEVPQALQQLLNIARSTDNPFIRHCALTEAGRLYKGVGMFRMGNTFFEYVIKHSPSGWVRDRAALFKTSEHWEHFVDIVR